MSNPAPVSPVRAVLCADDFALTEGTGRGILDLIAADRLTATGAMTNRPHWSRLAGELVAFSGKADLGVHLNLTCGAPLTAMPVLAPQGRLPDLASVMRLAMLSADAQREIAQEIAAQLDAFAQAAGRAPDFIDGHQHVHALRGIREALLEVAGRLYPAAKPYLRNPADRVSRIRARGICVTKALTISALASGFAKAARRAGFACNDGFSGVSAFRPEDDFQSAMAAYLRQPGPRHLIMCHPGLDDPELHGLDPVIASRPVEYRALMALEPATIGLELVRFRDFGSNGPDG